MDNTQFCMPTAWEGELCRMLGDSFLEKFKLSMGVSLHTLLQYWI